MICSSPVGTKWGMALITSMSDRWGIEFASKLAFLECVGLLVPFLTAPDLVRAGS